MAPALCPRGGAKESTVPHLDCQLLGLWARVGGGRPRRESLRLKKAVRRVAAGWPEQEQKSLAAHQNSPVECSLAAGMSFLFRTCQETAGAGENSY